MIATEEKNLQLIEFLENLGFSSFPIDGYKVVNMYTSLEEEIESIYRGVVLRNISHQGIIELKGSDALDLLNRISTNRLKDLPKEGVKDTIFTSDKGKFIGLSTLMNFENYQLMVCDRSEKQKLMSWIKRYVISDNVEVNDANIKYNLLELSGPQADSFATLICGNVVNEMRHDSFKIIHTENILFFLIKLRGERGLSKFWFLSDLENSKRLISYIMMNKGIFNFNMIGEEAYNVYRIEQGIPIAPNELNDEINPLEAGLTEYINFEKGCFIGQEVIARLKNYNKIPRELVGLKFSEPLSLNNGQLILMDNETEVGKVTSYANSFKLKSPIGLGYVHKSHIKPFGQLSLKISENKSIQVSVQPLPFIK
jgi:folate-binding protein YgfZ